MKVAHFICKRAEVGPGLRHVAPEPDGRWTSGNWDMSEEQARSLIGGRIYLHSSKAKPSVFGGRVVDVRPVTDTEVAREARVVFVLEPTKDDKGVKWRGRSDAMASYGGIVEVD